jgi:hypothetical protein
MLPKGHVSKNFQKKKLGNSENSGPKVQNPKKPPKKIVQK